MANIRQICSQASRSVPEADTEESNEKMMVSERQCGRDKCVSQKMWLFHAEWADSDSTLLGKTTSKESKSRGFSSIHPLQRCGLSDSNMLNFKQLSLSLDAFECVIILSLSKCRCWTAVTMEWLCDIWLHLIPKTPLEAPSRPCFRLFLHLNDVISYVSRISRVSFAAHGSSHQ